MFFSWVTFNYFLHASTLNIFFIFEALLKDRGYYMFTDFKNILNFGGCYEHFINY